jgi:hypothetical protein
MDITTDGFGFMLSVGDLAWVPFVYSLQARYLVFKPVELGPVWTAAVFLVNLSGYYIFRGANGEKNDFRNGRNPKSEVVIYFRYHIFLQGGGLGRSQILQDGQRIETSYFWLVGSLAASELFVCPFTHVREVIILNNYSSGDLLMALAWSLPTGFGTPITYFYIMYFTVLLIHRQHRDDENCEKKYVFWSTVIVK